MSDNGERLKPVFFDGQSLDELVDVVMSAHGRALCLSNGMDIVPPSSRNKVQSACASICSMYPERFSCMEEQAATLACRLAKDHCFPDGNKRTAIITAITFMETYGRAVSCSDDEFVQAALAAARDDTMEVMDNLLSS